MRIAVITPTFPPKTGGIGQVAFKQAEGLAKLGHEVKIYTPEIPNHKFSPYGGSPASLWEVSRRETGRQITNKFVPSGHLPKGDKILNSKFQTCFLKPFLRFGNAAFLPQLYFILKKEKFDIVHLHYPFFGAAEVVALWEKYCKLKIKNCKFVLSYHHDVVGRGLLGRFFSWHTRWLMPKVLDSAGAIIVSSFDYALNSVISAKYKTQSAKFFELPFGIDLNIFSPKSAESALSAESAILFVGGLDRAHYFKGLEVLLKAVASYKLKAKSYKLVIVGDGDLRPHYERLAKTLGLEDRVIFVGRVPEKDLPDYYRKADLFVLPSIDKTEAFGLVILEAMACGKPVIASNLPGVRTLVEDNKTGYLVEPKNIDDLAEKICKLLQDKKLRESFGQAARQRAEEGYDEQKIIKRLEEIYTNV